VTAGNGQMRRVHMEYNKCIPSPYRATSIVQYSKFQMLKAFLWQPVMDRCEAGAWSTANEFATLIDWEVSS